MNSKEFYRRRLPHWQPQGTALFITWRLHGSIPRPRPITSGDEFVQFDHALDRIDSGPMWLKDPRVAKWVADAFHYGQDVLHLYELDAWAILSNHVHLLIRPHADLAEITRVLKGYTAYRANRALRRKGRPFWQDESFDHWVRSAAEFRKVVRYIENNPVKAGLVERPEDWPWSSAWGRHSCLPAVS